MARYETVLENPITDEIAVIKSNDFILFEEKKRKKIELWERKEVQRQVKLHKENNKAEAEERTLEARQEIEDFQNILKSTLEVDDAIDWDSIKSVDDFHKYKTQKTPKWEDFSKDIPAASFFEFIGVGKKSRLLAEERETNNYKKALVKHKKSENKQKKIYEKEKELFILAQKEFNKNLGEIKIAYEKPTKTGIIKYFNLVLERSDYPERLTLNYDLTSDPNSNLILVDIEVPNKDSFPQHKEFKYIASRNEITEKSMGKKEFEAFYDDVVYQLILRTIHEVFESDYKESIDTIVLNAWVDSIDSSTGNPFRACIATVQTNRDDFLNINLGLVNPKDCFKSLKGITAGSLIQFSPVKPIMKLDTNDKRLVAAEDILDGLDEKQNLASMEWQDFEVLVRDLFVKEFSHDGCKVEVTQASRDAGVDAIAFDEDPIRGGKYVIQAKRYNNIVPLTAVRDLYGTVMNEGAVKGILVTTSYFGKDSLEFVKDKPLKLINGEELLYMFNKYGYKLKIELKKKEKRASSKSY